MARLGFRTLDEMVGRADCVVKRALEHPKAKLLDFERVLMPAVAAERIEEDPATGNSDQPPPLDLLSPSSTDEKLLEGAHLSIKYGEPSVVQIQLTNADRAFGARLAGEIARKHGAEGLRDGTIVVEATGTAGQSFGAFATRGMLLVLEGDANDYVGKGLSGGVLVVKPPARVHLQGARERDRRQHVPLRRDEREGVLRRPRRASASRCATAARSPSSRASATTAAST